MLMLMLMLMLTNTALASTNSIAVVSIKSRRESMARIRNERVHQADVVEVGRLRDQNPFQEYFEPFVSKGLVGQMANGGRVPEASATCLSTWLESMDVKGTGANSFQGPPKRRNTVDKV
jgi:hypothetical protein